MYIPYVVCLSLGRNNDIESDISKAMKTTGLNDFGGKEFIKLYSIARKIGFPRSEARFSPLGFFTSSKMMTQRLADRLRLIDFVKRHPTVGGVKFSHSPTFIIGFPRTGTTHTHELLSMHPGVRCHHSWEIMSPIPTTDDESPAALMADRECRYNAKKKFFELFWRPCIGDEFQAIHRIEYDAPEECTVPCSMEVPWNLSDLPSMILACEELLPLGAGEAFSIYRRWLQLQSWQAPELQTAWMLKCPFHLPYLDDLHAEFPNSTLVWTHRSPVEHIASLCSLIDVGMKIFIDAWTIDRIKLGRAVLQYTKLSLTRALDSIEKNKSTLRVVHVRYKETIKDARNMCRRVCDATSLPFSDDYSAKIEAYLAESKAKRAAMAAKGQASGGKKGKLHTYSLEDYGLTNEQVEAEFKDYIEKYC